MTARIIARSGRPLLDRDAREFARILLKVVEAHRKVTERRGVKHADIGLPAGDHTADLVGRFVQSLPKRFGAGAILGQRDRVDPRLDRIDQAAHPLDAGAARIGAFEFRSQGRVVPRTQAGIDGQRQGNDGH